MIYKGKPIGYHQTSQQNLYKPEESGNNIQHTEREKRPAKNNISLKYGEIRTFPDIQKLREFITRKSQLQEILKRLILPETKRKRSKHYT